MDEDADLFVVTCEICEWGCGLVCRVLVPAVAQPPRPWGITHFLRIASMRFMIKCQSSTSLPSWPMPSSILIVMAQLPRVINLAIGFRSLKDVAYQT